MKTQKFVAPTLKEALARVREELGEDALIIKSEKVKAGGPVSRIRSELIEVTAAIPDEAETNLPAGPEFAQTLERTLENQGQKMPVSAEIDLSRIRDEVQRLRDDLNDIGKYIKNKNLPNLPKDLAEIWQALGRSGVNAQWASDLAQEALLQLGPEELISPAAIENHLMTKLASMVKPAPMVPHRRLSPYKIALLGAPGAGKTTLLQKLASDPVAYAKRKVGLLSLDTHRMAAIEQLRAFARIAGTPLEVVFKESQCATALAHLASCEIILIDTPGCPVWDSEKLALLRAFMERLDPDEIHLVLNATVRDEELIYAGRRFREVMITHLSFTRLDEALRHGFLLNVVRAVEKPVAWLSRGQNFMGCLERFTTEHLRKWTVLSEPLPDISAPEREPVASASKSTLT